MTPLSAFQHHRGWLVVLGAFLIQVVGFGAIYSSPAFSVEIAASLGKDRADTDLVMVLSLGGSFLVSAISGSLADRFGPRPLAAFGMILVTSGLPWFANLILCICPSCGKVAVARLARQMTAPTNTKRLARREARDVRLGLASVGWRVGSISGPASTRCESGQGYSR
jgi:predicted MFS family arabinose efflux permease